MEEYNRPSNTPLQITGRTILVKMCNPPPPPEPGAFGFVHDPGSSGAFGFVHDTDSAPNDHSRREDHWTPESLFLELERSQIIPFALVQEALAMLQTSGFIVQIPDVRGYDLTAVGRAEAVQLRAR